MKIYTKTGDQGKTSLFGGTRVAKYHLRIASYGTLDELNSWLGLIGDQEINAHSAAVLKQVQAKLFVLGAILATDPEKARLKSGKERLQIAKIHLEDIVLLEQEIDAMNAQLPEMTHFILPGGHPTVSYCHIARTVCRRAERLAVQLQETAPLEEHVLPYINRLSDYLFVLSRTFAQELGVAEVKWIPETKKEP